MRILAAMRARTMAGTASTPSVATPWRSSWRLWTGRRRRAWVFLWGVAKSCGSGGLARRQISAPAAVSGEVLRGLQRVAFTDEAGGPIAIGQVHLAQSRRRRDQRQKAAHL